MKNRFESPTVIDVDVGFIKIGEIFAIRSFILKPAFYNHRISLCRTDNQGVSHLRSFLPLFSR